MFLRSTYVQALGLLNTRVILAIGLMRFEERTATADQHFVPPGFNPMMEHCENVRPFERARNFRFRIDATS